MYWLSGGEFSSAGGSATQSWNTRSGSPSSAPPSCQTPPPAFIHSRPPVGTSPRLPVVSSYAKTALQHRRQRRDARVRVDTRELRSRVRHLRVIEKHERLQHLAEVGRAHEARDRAAFAARGAMHDAAHARRRSRLAQSRRADRLVPNSRQSLLPGSCESPLFELNRWVTR